jgi:hypothetical protein
MEQLGKHVLTATNGRVVFYVVRVVLSENGRLVFLRDFCCSDYFTA